MENDGMVSSRTVDLSKHHNWINDQYRNGKSMLWLRTYFGLGDRRPIKRELDADIEIRPSAYYRTFGQDPMSIGKKLIPIMTELYISGTSSISLKHLFNISRALVRKLLINEGIRLRTQFETNWLGTIKNSGDGHPFSIKFSKNILSILIELYNTGMSMDRIAKISGTSSTTLKGLFGRQNNRVRIRKSWEIGWLSALEGADNPSYKDGKRGLYPREYYDRRPSIIERDNGQCQYCHEKGTHCHHINFDRADNRSENLIILCKNCHHNHAHGPNRNAIRSLLSDITIINIRNYGLEKFLEVNLNRCQKQ